MKKLMFVFLMACSAFAFAQTPTVKTRNGILKGVLEASGVRSFKGIPYAQPPVGKFRWREPQMPLNWTGVRMADKFGNQAMQQHLYGDMIFRSAGNSEDCLYLNVWAPVVKGREKLAVLVYFYGGGFRAGDGSEYRYDGEALAKRGIITVTVNYRLGIFGFMAHPELTKESPNHASGNYGLMDQHAALVWVKNNIARFGGDPSKITIGGESAGSMSVSAQIASPLSKDLFRGAIAESGAMLGNLAPMPLADAEKSGVAFAQKVNASSLADLRNIPADSLLKWAAGWRVTTTVDGYFLPQMPEAIFTAGKQMNVALLAGWNSAEGHYRSIIGQEQPTVQNYKTAIEKLYGDKAPGILEHYPATDEASVKTSGTALAGDRFISYASWKLVDLHTRTGKQPVYRYFFTKSRPVLNNGEDVGAVHSAEIEYALGNLPTNKVYNWTADDFKVSETMQAYFVNFVKTGNPNGNGLPVWYNFKGSNPAKIMVIGTKVSADNDRTEARYRFFNSLYKPLR